MKIEEFRQYLLDNNVSYLRYENEINEYETYMATIGIDALYELKFASCLAHTKEKIGADSFYKKCETYGDRSLNDENFNLEVEFIDEETVLVTLTEIKMGEQNIRHNLLHRLPMKIIKIKSLNDILLEDYNNKL